MKTWIWPLDSHLAFQTLLRQEKSGAVRTKQMGWEEKRVLALGPGEHSPKSPEPFKRGP